jgi:nucleotide-binding universal stress UspA family protein
MYRHILVATDGSELAEHGVANGLALAKSLGAKISVIVVLEGLEGLVRFSKSGQAAEGLAKYAEWRKEHATSVLNRAANAAKEAGVSCETILGENEQPYQAIISAAKDKACDLIVMTSHGRSGLSKLLLGSVTNEVLTYSKTPVLVCQ